MHWGSASYTQPSSIFTFKITEDSSSITVFNINAHPDNQGKSIEELRYFNIKQLRQAQPFGPNSSTPEKYSYTGSLVNNNQSWQNRTSNFTSSGFNSNSAFAGSSAGSAGLNSGQNFVNSGSGFRNQSGSYNSGSSYNPSTFNRTGFDSQSNFAGNNYGNSSFASGTNPFKPSTPVNNPFATGFNSSNHAGMTGSASGNPFASGGQAGGFNNTNSGINPFNASTGQGGYNSGNNGFSSGFPSNPSRTFNISQGSQSNPFSSSQGFNSNTFTTSNSSLAPGANPFTSTPSQHISQSSNPQMNPFSISGSYGSSFPSSSSSFQSNPFSSAGAGSSFYAPNVGLSISNTGTPVNWSSQFPGSNPLSQSSNFPTSGRLGQTQSNPSSFYSQNNSFFQPSSSNPYFSSSLYSQASGFNSESSQMPSFGGNIYNSMASTLTNPSTKPDFPVLSNPFKDPHGLTWIFPDEDPEKLVTEFKIKETTPSVSSLVNRKAPEAPVPLGSSQQDNFTINEPAGLLAKYKKNQEFCFVKREKSKKMKFKRNFSEAETFSQAKPVMSSEEPIKFLVVVNDMGVEERLQISAFLHSSADDIKEKVMLALNTNKQFVMKLNDQVLHGYETVANLKITSKSKLFFETQGEEYPDDHHLPVTETLKVTPDLQQMKKMTLKQLRNIEKLVLENAFGRIEFEGKVDVVGIDFDQFISFKSQQFIGFPYGETSDQRLNKPAYVTLYNIKPRKNPGKVEIDLRIKCEENGTEFIKYDQLTHDFTFKIQHL